jgi:hypothetical protein
MSACVLPAPAVADRASPRRAAFRGFLALVPIAIWLLAITAALVVLAQRDATPGQTASAPTRWPAAATPALAPGGRFTLLLFLHPKCPCSRATLGELEILTARCLGKMETTVLFVRPTGVAKDWERSDLFERASRIPGVAVRTDEAGVDAGRFGAMTSGQALLYDASGALRFAGGITATRGHAGDNAGRSAIEDIVADRATTVATTAVFGCPLLGPLCAAGGEPCAR